MNRHHGSTGVREQTYAYRFADACTYPIRDPLRFLAAAVIARWADDRRKGIGKLEIGEEWAEVAEIPKVWLT